MKKEIIISGFGGQGVILAGSLLAQAAIEQNLYTTCFPSYGAEMRGGTAKTTVIISDGEIGSPISTRPDILIVLNEPSFNKFMPLMRENSIVIANSSMIPQSENKTAFKSYFIPLTDIADKEIGNIKSANLAAIGALIKISQVLSLDNVLKACENVFKKKQNFIEINKKAILAGMEAAGKLS
ncbi:MAG: 2-oxoacid:acceptor oxidoreductase family protein [Elusimicrobiota bacterium]|jgi:2-oxoglutarate ferredoxin oxidoreductase subunit gamma|nr:2-oxoacid:acceptor oxidoreductase family protein [Elusimicrobiota bacterium]